MNRRIVNVATGPYVRGQRRLWDCGWLDGAGLWRDGAQVFNDCGVAMMTWADKFPPDCPEHFDVPYAFKAYALKFAAEAGAETLLWADACILPIAPLDSLWERIERDGAWICRNGWTNYEWTADSAYDDLGVTREENREIPHVVATAFGLSLNHPTGRAIFDEYVRLGTQTLAFCGPWWNDAHPANAGRPQTYKGLRWREPCGPPDVMGHRHDQAALSVLAWQNGVELSSEGVFTYRGGETAETVLVADSSY